tara:strand:- start:25746 stop:27500 length:1755 start_codon:yes stop_codon:yes gene_type:complete
MLQDSLSLLRSQFLGLSRVLSTITELVSSAVQHKDESGLLRAATELLIQNHNFQYVTVHLVFRGELQLSTAMSTRSILRGDIDETKAEWVNTCGVIAKQLMEQQEQQEQQSQQSQQRQSVVKRTVADTFYYASPILYQEEVLGIITVNAPSLDENHNKFLPVFASTLANLLLNTRRHTQLSENVQRRSEELETAWESAKQSDVAKSRFLNNVSHEYLTPLNAINAASSLLNDTHLSSEQQECLNTIVDSTKKLSGMVGGTLDFVLSESGNLPGATEQINLGPFSQQLIAEMGRLYSKPDLDLQLGLPASPPTVVVDTKLLGQILSHLLSNALKFTSRGFVRLDVIPVKSSGNLIEIKFCVSDSGIGIAHEDQKNIFNAFHQLNGSSTRPYEGTGLGLALSQRIADMMGSKILVTSEPGAGAQFEFTLQLPMVSRENKQAVTELKRSTNHVSVLLVEDNLINQKLAARLLEKMGCEVDIANDGIDAVAKFSRTTYDLVFMDCQMPNMDGFEATSKMRELESISRSTNVGTETTGLPGHRTPIIALTANSLPADRDRSFRVGMDEFLTKPIAKEKLKDALTRWSPG